MKVSQYFVGLHGVTVLESITGERMILNVANIFLTSFLSYLTLGLYPSFSANPPYYRSLSFLSFKIHYMDFPDCLLLLLSISVFFTFYFFLFLHFFSCRFRAVDYVDFRAHIKIASRIVSYTFDTLQVTI